MLVISLQVKEFTLIGAGHIERVYFERVSAVGWRRPHWTRLFGTCFSSWLAPSTLNAFIWNVFQQLVGAVHIVLLHFYRVAPPGWWLCPPLLATFVEKRLKVIINSNSAWPHLAVIISGCHHLFVEKRLKVIINSNSAWPHLAVIISSSPAWWQQCLSDTSCRPNWTGQVSNLT